MQIDLTSFDYTTIFVLSAIMIALTLVYMYGQHKKKLQQLKKKGMIQRWKINNDLIDPNDEDSGS